MTTQTPTSLEALKLRLVHQQDTTHGDPLLTKDGIGYLIKALEYADASFSADIETALVKVGRIAIPFLIKALTSSHNNVRSVAAMALIRLGPACEDALLKAYVRYSQKPSLKWVFDTVLQELNLTVAAYSACSSVSREALTR